MNGWVFFNNLIFGFVTGLTIGLIQSTPDTDQPAYITAWHVGNIIGWILAFAILIRIYNLEGLF